MKTIISDNFNDLFANSIYQIHESGIWTKPRGYKCKEIISPQLVLTNPRKCICTMRERKLNRAFSIVEKMAYLSGEERKTEIISYNSNMSNFLNEKTNHFDGSYGPRIGKQLKWCYDQLVKDPDTRQAVITIRNESDCHETVDHPCTLSLQFLLRENLLYLIVTMRSNDVLWGLCYDVPSFCFLQEVMAHWLHVKLGVYIHNAGSFHYYDLFEKQLVDYYTYLDDIGEIVHNGTDNDYRLPRWDVPEILTDDALKVFWDSERKIRMGQKVEKTGYEVINTYLKEIKSYWAKKKKVINTL